MSLADLQSTLDDPKFQALPFQSKRAVMAAKDPDFSALSPESQMKVMNIKDVGNLGVQHPVQDWFQEQTKWDPNKTSGENIGRLARQSAHLILPAAGMVAGASVAGPAGALAGGTMGAAAGEELANLGEEAAGDKPAPSTPGEVAAQTGADLAAGAATMVGGKVGDLTGEVLEGPLKNLAPTDSARLAALAESMGVKLRPEQLSTNPTVGQVAALLKKFPGTATTMHADSVAQAQALDQISQKILADIGSLAPRTELGQAVQGSAVEAPIAAAQAAKNAAYDKAMELMPQGAKVDMGAYSMQALNALDQMAQLPPEAANPQMQKFLEMAAKSDSLTPVGVKLLRERLNDMIGPVVDTADKRTLVLLKNGLDQDLANFADKTGGDFASSLKRANELNSSYRTLKADPFVKKLVASSPEQVVDKLMQPGNITGLQVIKTATPAGTWEDTVEPAIINRLFSGKNGIGPQDIMENYPAGKLALTFQKNMQQYGSEQLSQLLSPEKVSRLQDFAKVMDAVKSSPDVIAGNASGTASSLMGEYVGPMAMATYIVKNPITGIPMALSAPAMAKLWLSDAGREIATEGLRPILTGVAVSGAKATGVATALKLLEKVSMDDLQKRAAPAAPPAQTQGDLSAAELPGQPPQNPDPDAATVAALPPSNQAERGALVAFMNHNDDKALELARQAYADNSQNFEARNIIERILKKRGDISGLRKELGYK